MVNEVISFPDCRFADSTNPIGKKFLHGTDIVKKVMCLMMLRTDSSIHHLSLSQIDLCISSFYCNIQSPPSKLLFGSKIGEIQSF